MTEYDGGGPPRGDRATRETVNRWKLLGAGRPEQPRRRFGGLQRASALRFPAANDDGDCESKARK